MSTEEDENRSLRDAPRKVKRRRIKRTCLPCERRKTKCDKKQPCTHCSSRNEQDQCVFAGGVQPLPSTISLERDEYIAVLENRVRSLESHIKPLIAAHACPFTSLGSSISTEGLNGSRASCSRTHSEFETVGRQIEDLIATETPRIRLSRGVEPLTVSQQTDCIESQRWPHIMSPRSPDSRSSKWKSDMLSALSSVPNGQLVEYLLKYYFDSEEAYRRVFVPSVLLQEVREFEITRLLGVQMSVDPAWLAQLTAALWIASVLHIDSSSDPPLPSPFQAKDEMSALGIRLFEAFQTALVCADWTTIPQMRVLLALLVATAFGRIRGTHFANPNTNDRRFVRTLWFDCAVGICKSLRLHLDPPAEELAKLQDPVFPAHLPTYSREVCRRAFYQLLGLDTTHLFTIPLESDIDILWSFPEGTYRGTDPSNYDDANLLDLSPGDPKETWVVTDNVWECHQNILVGVWRKLLMEIRRRPELPYPIVLRYTNEIKAAHYKLTLVKTMGNLTRKQNLQFDLTNISFQQRILRLHRPFHLMSLSDDSYLESRQVAVGAAKQILIASRRIFTDHNEDAFIQTAIYPFLHHTSALLALFITGLCDQTSLRDVIGELNLSQTVLLSMGSARSALLRGVSQRGCTMVGEMLRILAEHSPLTSAKITVSLTDLKARLSKIERSILINGPQLTLGLVDVPAATVSSTTDGQTSIDLGSQMDGIPELLGQLISGNL